MQTIKVTGKIREAVETYREAKAAEKTAKKTADSAKETISNLFNVDIGKLAKGETLSLTGGVKIGTLLNIERVDKSRIDIDAMRLAHPEIVAKFTVEKPEFHFKPVN